MARDGGKKTILVVDNDQDVRDMLRELISHMGHNVLTADRAYQALQIIEQESVDVLLLDIHMPGPHGHHLLRFLKNRKKPVPSTIVVSGYLNRELIPELIGLGVTGIMAKPFNPQRLRQEIDRVLGRLSEEAKFCTQCGHSLQPGDRFCRNCGRDLILRQKCSKCGADYELGDHFCGKCGKKLK